MYSLVADSVLSGVLQICPQGCDVVYKKFCIMLRTSKAVLKISSTEERMQLGLREVRHT